MITRSSLSCPFTGALAGVAAAAGVAALWLWAEGVDRRASGRWLGRSTNTSTSSTGTNTSSTRTRTRTRTGTGTGTGAGTGTGTGAGTNPNSRENAHPTTTTRSATPQHPTDAARSDAGRSDAVVVLGYRNRGERANFVNRFRVRAGIRSLDATAKTSTLILCGGAVGSPTPEAHLMQRYAREHLGFTGTIVLDDTSRSTWQNIANAIPHLERADTIKIVSNAPHGQMGREILWHQRPDLAQRLIRGAEHRFGEAPLLKVLSALRAKQSKLSGAWAKSADPLKTTPRQPRP